MLALFTTTGAFFFLSTSVVLLGLSMPKERNVLVHVIQRGTLYMRGRIPDS